LIAIVDYGVGNLNSVANMVRHVGGKHYITSNPSEIASAEKLILPGVGSFDRGMEALGESGIMEALSTAVLQRGVPILGICLGMQLMTKQSEEGRLLGLGWLNAEVKRFLFPEPSNLKVPHMGWNTISILCENPLIQPMERQRFYFVHSYYVACSDETDVLATCNYGFDFVAAFARGNIFGVQFHPEKSHRFGMALMRQFVEMGTC
jgi:imidazole glycerol-phosphate synthase subunit HisH